MATTDQKPQSGEQNKQPFESDAQKLANRHLADQNHQITDEEFRSIRVGMTPVQDEPTSQAVEETEDRIADKEPGKDDETIPGAQKITPWDVVE